MNFFLTLLEIFILKLLFNKDEYNIKSKHFNPLKIVIIFILVSFSTFGVYLTYKFIKMADQIEKKCPALYEKNM